jgi:hypothetical protein
LQNDASQLIIGDRPFFYLLQGAKTAKAGQVIVQAAIAYAWGLGGAVDISHARFQLPASH